jgi:hypothetical protein
LQVLDHRLHFGAIGRQALLELGRGPEREHSQPGAWGHPCREPGGGGPRLGDVVVLAHAATGVDGQDHGQLPTRAALLHAKRRGVGDLDLLPVDAGREGVLAELKARIPGRPRHSDGDPELPWGWVALLEVNLERFALLAGGGPRERERTEQEPG